MLLCGRGLKLVKAYTDTFYLNEKGNAITLVKIYPGGSDAAGANQSQ
jgi:anti-sigma regulatory factor (Ser/Thr protein kinase)